MAIDSDGRHFGKKPETKDPIFNFSRDGKEIARDEVEGNRSRRCADFNLDKDPGGFL